MIKPIQYDPSNFKPILIDEVQVPESLIQLASLSPSFSPTPTKYQPPDGNQLHNNLMEFKRVLGWNHHFRKIQFNDAITIEEFLNFQQSEFVKPPWYEKSTREPPPLPPLLEQAFEKIYSTVMNPSFWYTYQPNLSVAQRQAMAIARTLPSKDVGIYSQDKSSRICFASLSKTNEKVEMVLADSSKYKKLSKDMATTYQPKIKSWYAKYKKTLSSIPDDVSKYLLPSDVATPHLKVLIKTHKVGCPVRLTFSSIGSVTSHLSTLLDHVYLKPIVNSGLCKRRLGDTRDALLFIETLNNHLWSNSIQEKPTIFAMDISNCFPSIKLKLALPAVSKYLTMRGLQNQEIKGVLEGLKVVRNGNFFKWKETYFNQISGCALGDPDSCSYSDIAIADLLDKMIPACESALDLSLDPFFKAYRDDGMGVVFCPPDIILDILAFFNGFDNSIQWTLPMCSVCSIPEAVCPHYQQMEFLDCLITWKQIQKGDILVWQFQVQSYSKPTDCHAYLHPSSCTAPHLNSKGVSLAKTVGTRLRTIHTNDNALLQDLNLFSGYMFHSGSSMPSLSTNGVFGLSDNLEANSER